MDNEPVWTIAGIVSIVVASLTLATAFGIPITEAQSTAIIGFVGTIAPLLLAYFARKRVSPAPPRRRGTRGMPEL